MAEVLGMRERDVGPEQAARLLQHRAHAGQLAAVEDVRPVQHHLQPW
jgi:hypothetical protein